MYKKEHLKIPDPFPYRRAIVGRKLPTMALRAFSYRLTVAPDDLQFHIMNGSANQISASCRSQNGKRISEVDSLFVHQDMQHNGIGGRLLKGLVCLAETHGVSELWSHSVSSEALGARAKAFGQEVMRYFDSDQDPIEFLPFTFNEAVQTARHNEGMLPAVEDKLASVGSLGVFIDLNEVSTQPWQSDFATMIIEDLGVMGD